MNPKTTLRQPGCLIVLPALTGCFSTLKQRDAKTSLALVGLSGFISSK